MPETVSFAAWDGPAHPVATANELGRLGVTLSDDTRIWGRRSFHHLHSNYSWAQKASSGQVNRALLLFAACALSKQQEAGRHTRTYTQLLFSRIPRPSLILRQIGCTVSHIGAWARVAEASKEDVPYSIILEDDAVVLPTFERNNVRALVDDLDQMEGEWHLCYIYLRPEDRGPGGPSRSSNSSHGPAQYSWSLLAYVVSHAGAQRLLELARSEPLIGPIDDVVSLWSQKGHLRAFSATTLNHFGNAG